MTALENVLVGRHCRTKSGVISAPSAAGPAFRREERESRSGSRELLEFVGLPRVRDELARNLPYGDQRRLEIARALATEPGLLLLDEPTAGMNPHETRGAMELVRQIRDQGLAVVVIEHDMRFIFSLCDRVAVLVQGKKLLEGTPAEVQHDPGSSRPTSATATDADLGAAPCSRSATCGSPTARSRPSRASASRCRPGRDADRRQRRGQDDHAAHHLGAAAARRRADRLRRATASTKCRPTRSWRRDRPVARGPADLPPHDRAREPRPRGVHPAGAAEHQRRPRPGLRPCSRCWPSAGARPPARCRAASSRCSPSAGR